MTNDDAQAVANESARKFNQAIAALMVDAVDQVRRQPNTMRHEESTLLMLDLAAEALDVPYIEPQAALMGLARANAAVIVALCTHLKIDPESLMKGYEESYFVASLSQHPPE